MPKVAIIYFSETDTTHKLAMAVGEGCASIANTCVVQYRIVGSDIAEGRFRNLGALELVDDANAVLFGSPTYMGGPAAQFKAFADATSERWESQQWSGKLAAGFTAGSSPNGDQLATVQYFSILAAQQGMLWAGLDIADEHEERGLDPLGCQLGLTAHCPTSDVHNDYVRTAHYLGARVATLCHRLSPS